MTLRDPLIIALSGHAGSGKTTAAAHLVEHYGFVPLAFADALKDMIELHLISRNIDYAWLHEPELKGQPIPALGLSARQLMQSLGDWGRALRADWWVTALASAAGMSGPAHAWAPVHDRLVITDVRYPNEARWVRQCGGWLIRLLRADAPPVREHDSERHLRELGEDVRLENDGPTVCGLYSLLDMHMERWGIGARRADDRRAAQGINDLAEGPKC